MSKLRRSFERFCYKHQRKGIPNLMLYIVVITAAIYLFSIAKNDYSLYFWLSFDRDMILKGQVWRLLTYVFLDFDSNLLWMAIGLICYYSLGTQIERVWGTLRFNLFYLCGVVMMDIYCMIFNCYADVYYLNMSLFLAFATMFPDAQCMLFFIIPVRAWILAVFDLFIVLLGLLQMPFGPANLFSVISIANYFLFFGKDVVHVFPMSWRMNTRRLFRKGTPKKLKAKTIPFPTAGSYQATVARPQAPFTHRCTVCGRTDVSDPELEFRYCSRCKGYHCYCQDHISNHSHVE